MNNNRQLNPTYLASLNAMRHQADLKGERPQYSPKEERDMYDHLLRVREELSQMNWRGEGSG